MSKKILNIKERVLYFAEKQEVSKQEFFRKTGLKYSNFTGKSKESDLTSNYINEILLIYPKLNTEWLLTGEGDMLKTSAENTPKTIKNALPLIPIEAMAGFGGGAITIMDYETSNYVIPEFEELHADFMIRVRGSSMYPKYNSGDIVACRKVALDTFFQWNRVYVMDTSNGAMIKRVHPGKHENSISCVSDNEKYLPFDLPLTEVYSLALVVGVIRLE